MREDKKRAVVLAPKSPEARFELGEALFLEGDLDGAVTQLEKTLELDAEHANGRRLLARVYLAQDRLTLAEKLLLPAADTEDVAACDALADLYVRLERADDALLFLHVAARREPEQLERHLRAAELALALGLLVVAAEHVAQAARLAPTDRRVHGLNQELAQRRGDVLGATESPLARGEAFLLGRALASVNRLAAPALAGVVLALRSGDLAQARRALVVASSAIKGTYEFSWTRGELALAGGELALATRAFGDAAEASSGAGKAQALRRVGELGQFGGDHAAARAAFEHALAAHEDLEGLEGLGDALAALADLAAAEDAYRRASKLDPASAASNKLAALRARRKHGTARESNIGRIGALGWSARGGLVSPVEAACIPGKGELLFTGNVGSVGREAAQVAASCVRARAAQLGFADRVATTDLHVHFTDMAIAKDGASAGLALALAATSAYKDEELLPALAATGEITVNGAVKPVAGLHEKLVAACLAGIRMVLVPRRCIVDLEALPREVRRRVAIHGVDSLPEAIELAFGLPPSTRPS